MQIEAGSPDAHVVLTLRRTATDSPDHARQRLGRHHAEFFRRLGRMWGSKPESFVVAERTKAGWPHLHVAVRGWRFKHYRQVWALWRDVTGDSDHVRVRRIPARRAKKYLAKYLGKDLHRFGTAKRYWRTRGYLPTDFGRPTEEECERWQGWTFVREHPGDIVRDYRSHGWFAHVIADGDTVLTPPPWETAPPRGPPPAAASGSTPGVRS